MRKIKKDITGKRYGKLIALRVDENRTDTTHWICQCDCGNVKSVSMHSMGKGNSKSCGCIRSESIKERLTKHGDHKKKEYTTWQNIKSRCNNPNNPRYMDYGGRGITMCKSWSDSYETFLLDMGHAPSKQHTVDRIKNNEGYSKENCRWATPSEQSNSKRNTRYVLFEGRLTTIRDASIKTGINYNTLLGLTLNGSFSNLLHKH